MINQRVSRTITHRWQMESPALVFFQASAATMTAPLPEVVGTYTALDLVPSNIADEPLLVLRVIELVRDRRQIERQLIGYELANLRVVVVAVEVLDIWSVGDQIDVYSAVAERRPFNHCPARERLAEVDLNRCLLELFGD